MRCPSSVVHTSSVVVNFPIFNFSLKPLNRIQWGKISTPLYQVCVIRVDGKNKMATPASDGWDIFDFYQVCVFRADGKTRCPPWPLIGWDIFNFSSENTERIQLNFTEARSQRPLPSLCFRADRDNKMAALASDWLRHFQLLLWNRWTEFNETW